MLDKPGFRYTFVWDILLVSSNLFPPSRLEIVLQDIVDAHVEKQTENRRLKKQMKKIMKKL